MQTLYYTQKYKQLVDMVYTQTFVSVVSHSRHCNQEGEYCNRWIKEN